jgi:hypothetical protein
MSTLSRYQKSGGFIQILQLIETCGKQKQDNFLQMIEKEDKRWSQAIREKMLTIEKVFSWQDAVLAEIAARLQELTIATAMHGLKPEDSERLLKTFTHSQRRNIDDLFKAKTSSPAEVNSAFLKILQEVRNMITHGYIRVDKFAPEMVIGEDIEDKLGKTVLQVRNDEPNSPISESTVAPTHEPYNGHHHAPAASHGAGHHANDGEALTLRTRLQATIQENNQLKAEVKILREKLTQIKKIA